MPVMMTVVARSATLLDYCSNAVLLTSKVSDALLASSKVARKWVLAKANEKSSSCCSRREWLPIIIASWGTCSPLFVLQTKCRL
jgi:hypothetical protein